MKLKLTESSELTIEKAGEEPIHAINQENGISVESFLALLKAIESFIPEFENAIEMHGAQTWIGERLHEAVHAGRTSIEWHLTNQYFSEFEIKSDTAHILIENYEMAKTRVGILKRVYRAYDFTVLRFMLTRLVHEDTHSHIHKTDYSALFSELVDKTERRIEDESPSTRIKIKKLPLELTAPIYLKEKEELVARRMQRFALNAFLKSYYEHDPDWYVLLGVPLFLPPHPEVVKEIKRLTKRDVDFKSGFLSTYSKILDEYASAIATSEEGIYEDARLYLQSRTDDLTYLAKQCLEGDYSGLRTREKELVWKPDCGMKI
ncbi:MAG TPA: hypothetical protein VMW40_07215 [Candidatus Bathyarchaeia archaeon]|nr:hypothetical protein [Candidatus Bathyarchaeia archaeon]